VAANLKPECMEAAARVVGSIVVALGDAEGPLSTGRELPGFLLREGAHVVEGRASGEAVGALLATPRGAALDRSALLEAGWSCVALPVDESQGGAALAWARALSGAAVRPAEVLVAKSASDVANGARAGRTVVLPWLHCG